MGLFRSTGPASATRPHLQTAALLGLLLALARIVVIGGAAWADGALWLTGDATGLLEHPGALAVLVGDSLLIAVCVQARHMTSRLGRKIPSAKPLLTKRYFRSVLHRRGFGPRGDFILMYLLLCPLGLVFVVNQTLAALNPVAYYGHDTFTSFAHERTFWAVRVSLIISWGLIAPYFASLLFAHCLIVARLVKKLRRRGLAVFIEGHPDRCGGYAFFGWTDVVYASGIAIILGEAALLIMTHGRVTLGSAFALLGIAVGAGIVSTLSIREILKTVRRKERLLKTKGFWTVRRGGHMSVDYATLIYATNFSPYTEAAARLAIGLRAVLVAPAMYRFIQLL